MELYAVKHKGGYLKDSPQGPAGVNLDKASVFKEHDSNKLKELMKRGEKEGFEDIHLVKLTIKEETC